MVWVLNGPNLGRLGRRQPEIYGSMSHDELVDHVQPVSYTHLTLPTSDLE